MACSRRVSDYSSYSRLSSPDRLLFHCSRFPVISGFRVSWDSRKPPGQRVLGVWLLQEPSGGSTANSGTNTPTQGGTTSPRPRTGSASSSMSNLLQATVNSMAQPAAGLVDAEPIKRVKGGKTYKIVTREYMAQGHDGFLPLKGNKYLVDDESGQLTSAIVRKYLLGGCLDEVEACQESSMLLEQDVGSSTASHE